MNARNVRVPFEEGRRIGPDQPVDLQGRVSGEQSVLDRQGHEEVTQGIGPGEEHPLAASEGQLPMGEGNRLHGTPAGKGFRIG